MQTQRRWIGYDTFKLLIALLLLAIIIILLIRMPAPLSAAVGQVTQTSAAVLPATAMPAVATAAPTTAVPATATAVPATATAVPATATLVPATATQAPATATAAPATPTEAAAAATATEAPAVATVQPLATATSQPQTSGPEGCPLAQPSRLAVGNKARVTTNLNLRAEAGTDKQILRVELPNVVLEIIGGPVCVPYQNGAYLWWNVKPADGVTGWSAEASLGSPSYFLEPVP